MTRTTTIGHVLTSLHVGGAERVALMLARQQVEDGHRVVVFSFEAVANDGALAADFEEAGITVRLVRKRARLDPSLPWRSGAGFVREGIEVVHTHNDLPLIYAAVAAKLLGRRVVHTTHGQHQGSKKQLMLRRAATLFVDRYVAVSEATAEYTLRLGEVPRGKLEVILNATDLKRFRPDPDGRAAVRSSWGVSSDAKVVGSVGRLAEVKNQPLMLRALSPLLKSGACDALVIAGGGPERGRLEALAAELGVTQQVKLIGEIRDVPQALAGMDIFTLSSHSEGLPLVLAEAMACGLPVVATDVGGVAKVVTHGTTGYVVPAGDEAELRARLGELLSDRALARSMGEHGREVAQQRYSMKRMAADYARAYGIVSGPRGRSETHSPHPKG